MTKEERLERGRIKVVHSALKKFIKNMSAKGYYAGGIGEGLDHSTEKQNYLGVTFLIENLPSIDFARKIEVEALQAFQKCINEEEGIQDYVAEYPYPIKFLDITFINKHRELGLFFIGNCREQIHYYQDTPDRPQGPSIEIHNESYEEAIQILAQQEMNPH